MGSMNYPYEWNPLRQEAPACWAAVHTVIANEDPEGLLCSCAPAGEYDPAVTDLVRLLLDEPVIESRVLEIWEHWFGPGSSLLWHPGGLFRTRVRFSITAAQTWWSMIYFSPVNKPPDVLQRLTASLAVVPSRGKVRA